MTPGTYEIRVRADKLAEHAARLGLSTEYKLAKALRLHQTNVHRFRLGETTPGTRVIAQTLGTLGVKFEQVFEVVAVDTAESEAT